MWSIFSRDPTSSFPYVIGDPVEDQDDRSIFTLHYAKKKGCDTPVSAFICQGSVHNNSELELARSAVRRLKTIKHPCILKYIDSLESDKAVHLITDPVTPLLNWLIKGKLSHQHKLNVAAWGLREVIKGLSFLVNDGNLEHLNICSSSIFVTPGGEWRIAGIEYSRQCCPPGQTPDAPPTKLPPSLNVYDPPERINPGSRKNMRPWSSDMWGLGCLMWEVYSSAPLVQSGALRNLSKLPSEVESTYKSLMQGDPGIRPNPRELLERLTKPGNFLHNDLIVTVDFLENIHIKQDREKERFFSDLTNRLDNIPEFIVKNKILPATLSAQQYSNVGSVALSPLFKMSKLLSTEEYQEKVLPNVVKLFSSTDRATRLQLLQQMESLVVHMDPSTVNDKVFGELASGFMDTNPTIREHTIKSILFLAPKLNRNNLNIEVLKHFARLQSKDEQGGIRTNCTVCLSKISSYLLPTTRQKCLISAFTRALRDPFPPARIAGTMALASTQQYYPVDQVAQRILPALCQLTLDPDKGVREAVFRVTKGFMGKLEKLSEDPSLREEMEKEVSAASASTATEGAAGWAGWAVGTLTSKFYKSSISSVNNQSKTEHSATNNKDTPSIKATPTPPPTVTPPTAMKKSPIKPSYAQLDDSTPGEGDGWGEDDEEWGSLEDTGETGTTKASVSSPVTSPDSGWNDEDAFEDWSNDNSKKDAPPSNTFSKPSSSLNWSKPIDPDSDEFFTALKSEETVSQVSSSSTSDWGSSWGDENSSSKVSTKSDREAKRIARQKQMEAKRAAKGPMKLGMKKT